MQGILYVAHGTRVKEGELQAIDFINKVKNEMEHQIQEISFLELSAPTVADGVKSCVEKGVSEILVIPLLLFSAQHAKTDIPEILKAEMKKYPHIQVEFGTPIGVTRLMVEAVVEQLSSIENPSNSQIVLIGRGSSDPEIQQDFAELASRVKLRTAFRNIDIAFLYGKGPQLEEVLLKNQHRTERLVLIPYLLFTGLLMKGLEKIQQHSTREVIITKRLGEMNYTIQAFKESIERNVQTLTMKEVV